MKKLILAILCALPMAGMAAQNGFAISYGSLLGSGDSSPDGLGGFNIAYTLQPDTWNWNNFAVLMDFSYGHWSTNKYANNSVVNTYAIAPVVRWYFLQNPDATPFLTGSIGGSYLSNTYIGNRDLGSHFAFQDQLGFGFAFGAQKNLYTTLQYLHYSNAGLASENDGMSVPLVLTLGYQF